MMMLVAAPASFIVPPEPTVISTPLAPASTNVRPLLVMIESKALPPASTC